MAEHAFFSPHNAEGSCSNISGQETLHDDLRWTSSEYHLLDELRKFAKLKSDILSHPLYEQLLEAHVACLCVGLPSQYFQALETQLADKHSVAIKYLMLGKDVAPDFDCSRKEIDEFMESYILLLHSLKKHLEEHLLPPTTKAMVEYYELEQSFQELTGDSSAKLVNATWYDAESTEEDLNFGIVGYDGLDDFKVGMDMQKERDRSLMEHVRQELKHELKEGYLECLTSIRDEILRKRQAGKLPADTTILKKWWNAHSKWPYPTEEDKRHMAQETGLELRQINNWFINHRKRNWSGQAMPIEASTSSEGASKSNTSNLSMP